MEEEIELRDISDELFIIPKETVDALFKLENPSDCVALYMLYYKTAKWQKTNQPKATDSYVAKCLHWGTNKIRNTKQILKENGLINIVQNRVDGKIKGWYIKVSYLVSENKIGDIKIRVEDENSKNARNPQVVESTSGKQETYALKYNNICLNNNNNICLENSNQNAHATSVCCVNKKSFVKPKLDEVVSYCKERNNNVDAEAFIDFYESNGWKVGRNSMKDWKAAVRTWERNYKNKQNSSLNNKKEIQFETVTSGDDPYDISFEEAHEEYGFDKKTYEEIMKAHGKTPRYDT